MANLQIQDSFEPYYAGRGSDDRPFAANDAGAATMKPADRHAPQRRRQLDLASRRLAELARRNGALEK